MVFYQYNKQIESEVEKYLSEKTGKKIKILSSQSLGGGCINNASRMNTNAGTYFLKWNARCEPDMFLREAEGLEHLKKAANGQLVIPEVFAAKKVDETPGFLVLSFLQSGHSDSETDVKLGRGLGFIHQYSNDKFGFYHVNYCGSTPQNNNWKNDWPVFFRDNRLKFLLNLIQKERPLPQNEVEIYEKLLEKIPVLILEKSTPVLIHGDLWSGNFMVTDKGPALIDPAVCFADREMEMAIMTMFGGFSQRFYNAYNEINPLPNDWKERNRLYQLYHVLNHYYLFGGGYKIQALQIAKSYL